MKNIKVVRQNTLNEQLVGLDQRLSESAAAYPQPEPPRPLPPNVVPQTLPTLERR